MAKRSLVRFLVALSLSLAVLCAAAAPARAAVWNPGDPGTRIWTGFVGFVAKWLGVVKSGTTTPPPPSTTSGGGGGTSSICPPSNPNCESGGGADPYGRP